MIKLNDLHSHSEAINFNKEYKNKSGITYTTSHNLERVPEQDTVETSTQQENSTASKKWCKIAAFVGVGVLTCFGIYFGHGKIKAKHVEKEAKKAAEEARKLAEQDRIKAQEEVRIKAEQKASELAEKQAAEKAKKEAETKARAEAEEKAKVEAQRIAQEKVKKEKIDTAYSDFNKKQDILWNEECNCEDLFTFKYLGSTKSFTDDIVKLLKTAEENGATEGEVKQLYKRIKCEQILTDTQVTSISDKISHDRCAIKHFFDAKKSVLEDVDTLSRTIPKQENETFASYMERLFNTRETNVAEKNKKHLEELRAKIKYTDELPNMEVTDEELKLLQEKNPTGNITRENVKEHLEACGRGFTDSYTSEDMVRWHDSEIEDIIIRKGFPRYSFQTKNGTPTPVVRWMHIDGNFTEAGNKVTFYKQNSTGRVNVDEFVEDTFKVGKKYIAPDIQSCSKSMHRAEGQFNDDLAELDVKFIIHPKGKVSRAADLGWGHYGANEVVYPKGSEFNILDKRLVEYVRKDGTAIRRWEIEMQEA